MLTRDVSIAGKARAILGLAAVVLVALATLFVLVLGRPSAPPVGPAAAGGGQAIVAGAAVAEPSVAPTPPPNATALSVATVENARMAAKMQLHQEFQLPCVTEGNPFLMPQADAARKLDEKITAAKVSGSGWIEDGELWLGEGAEAAGAAFGATSLYADEQETWLVQVVDKVPQAHQLIESRSETGKTAWWLLAQMGPCISEDPSID